MRTIFQGRCYDLSTYSHYSQRKKRRRKERKDYYWEGYILFLPKNGLDKPDHLKADLERARKTYKEGDYKWATIQIYYSMFHSARVLLYAKNLREHSHYCLIAAIKTLYVETKQIPASFIEGLQEAKNLREEADYYNRWSRAGCENLLELAKDFLNKTGSLIRK